MKAYSVDAAARGLDRRAVVGDGPGLPAAASMSRVPLAPAVTAAPKEMELADIEAGGQVAEEPIAAVVVRLLPAPGWR